MRVKRVVNSTHELGVPELIRALKHARQGQSGLNKGRQRVVRHAPTRRGALWGLCCSLFATLLGFGKRGRLECGGR